ncbi:MAG: glycosyltransferase family 1 protein [Smithella sp.]|jgi:glycosyltransferase involved in cell wall biosynthesis
MMKKIGFDATSITPNHIGGKNQVPLNLLRGFEKNKVADRFVVFCLPEMEKYFSMLIPHAVLAPVVIRKLWKQTITEIFIRTFILPGYVDKYQIDVLLFPTFSTGFRRYRIPTVVIPHDIQTQTNKERFSLKTRMLMAFYYHFDFKLRDRIVAISNFDKQEIAAIYPVYQEKIVQIYNPVFSELFISAGNHKASKPYITAVNIQFGHKNTITLIKAFERIKDTISHDLYLIGRVHAETANIVAYVHEHDLTNRIILPGFLDDPALAELLKGSALYVNPSLFEGFGMTAVEAMLAGVPVLVSNVSAVPEVTMGLCNYYEPPDDAEVLAEAMKKILLGEVKSDADQLKMISSKINAQYNYVKISRHYFDLLTSLIQNKV